MFALGMDIEGEEVAFADLRKFGEVVKKPFKSKALVNDMVNELHRAEREQFKTEGSFGESAWPDLSPKYKSWKERHYPDKSILRRTDKLYKSLTKETSDSIIRVSKRGRNLELGSEVSYAKYHQSKAARRKLPRRAPLDFPDRDIETGMGKLKFLWIIQTHVVSQFKKLSREWDVGPTAIERMLR